MTRPNFREGEIVLAKYRDYPNSPVTEYIAYIRQDVPVDSNTIPLINFRQDLEGIRSKIMLKTLDLRLESQDDVARLKRGKRVKRPKLGELYEVRCADPDVSSYVPDGNEGLSYRLVGCYSGIRPFGGHDYLMFSNVHETDPKKLNTKSKDTTYGRRIFNRVRQNDYLKITELIPK